MDDIKMIEFFYVPLAMLLAFLVLFALIALDSFSWRSRTRRK